jgi:chromosome partitioning protein
VIITIGGIKGGCGKSVTACNLVALRAKNKAKVLFCDADEQESSSDWVDHRIGLGIETQWTTVRLKGAAVRTELRKMKDDYDDIIIDCGGRDTASLRAALTMCDVFLVPFKPASFDIWTVKKVSDLVEEAKLLNPHLTAYVFINCAVTRGDDNDDAVAILSKAEGLILLPVMVGQRKAFVNATAEGVGVVEMKNAKKAADEIEELYSALFENQHIKNISMTHKPSLKSVMTT